jgi:hypothetical protein
MAGAGVLVGKENAIQPLRFAKAVDRLFHLNPDALLESGCLGKEGCFGMLVLNPFFGKLF